MGKPTNLVDTSTPRWLRALSAGVIVTCAAYAGSTVPGVRVTPGYSRFWEVGLYNVVALGSAVIVVMRAIRVPRARLAWSLLGGGMTSYAAATFYYSVHLQAMDSIAYPSLSDGLWVLFYPLSIAGVLVLAGSQLRQRQAIGPRAATPVDGLIVGLTISALPAAFALSTITDTAGLQPAAVITNVAYPVGDLIVLCLIVGVLTALGRSAGPEWWLLGAGMVSFAAADTWFLLQIASGSYTPGSPVDATWALAETLIAVAAWRDRRPRGIEPVAEVQQVRLGLTSLLLPALSGGVCLVVLVVSRFAPVAAASVWLATAALSVVLLRFMQAVSQATSLSASREQARTDELTGLPNRRAFYESLREAKIRIDRAPDGHPGPSHTVLLLDLDRFKEVNDSLGHRTGDDLLRQVARRLSDALGRQLELARLGGDEFAVLVRGPVAEAERVAGTLLTALEAPFNVGVMSLHVDGSIGLAALDRDHESGAGLARADVAMYSAKTQQSRIHVYSNELDGDTWDRLSLVEALRDAVHDGGLSLEYQPMTDLSTGCPTALEALVRWQHPSRGLVAPDDFLPMAEQTGLMPAVTAAVLSQALDHALLLRSQGVQIPVAINLSASDLLNASLCDSVLVGLDARNLPADALNLEITETLLVADDAVARATLERLCGHGVRLAVDDYGTGYSSLAYLHDLPLSTLKIDRVFVARVLTDPRTATIVRSTIGLAKDLGLTTVGEGVESQAQQDWLYDAGADAAQGWHLARPMSAAESVRWLRTRREVPEPSSPPQPPTHA